MSCNQKTELRVVYDDCGGFFLKRCCFSKGKFISEEDFFKKSIRELATYEVNPFDIDDILQCNHDCDFKPYIDTFFKERGISNYRVQSDFFVPSFSKLLTGEQKCK